MPGHDRGVHVVRVHHSGLKIMIESFFGFPEAPQAQTDLLQGPYFSFYQFGSLIELKRFPVIFFLLIAKARLLIQL